MDSMEKVLEILKEETKRDFLECEQDLYDLVMVDLLAADMLPMLFEISYARRLSMLLNEVDGNADAALAKLEEGNR